MVTIPLGSFGNTRIGGVLFFGIFLVMGLIPLGIGAVEFKDALASAHWAATEGTISSSQLETHVSSGRRGSTSITYGAEALYSYNLDGNAYWGNRVSFGEYSSSSVSHANKILAAYTAGKTTKVFYDPADPSKSVLEPGFNWAILMLPVFCLVFVLVGLCGVLSAMCGWGWFNPR